MAPNGTGLFAQPALHALIGRDAHAPFGQRGEQAQQRAIWTEETAIGPRHHGGQREDRRAEDEHARFAVKAEEGDEGVKATDEKIAAGGGEKHRRAQIEIRQQFQRIGEPGGHFFRVEQHHVLRGAQRAYRGAKDAPEEEGEDERQQEKDADDERQRVLMLPERHGDVLQRSHRADTALPIETEIGERAEHERKDADPRALFQHQIRGQRQRDEQQQHIEPGQPCRPRRRRGGMRKLIAGGELRRRKTLLAECHHRQRY